MVMIMPMVYRGVVLTAPASRRLQSVRLGEVCNHSRQLKDVYIVLMGVIEPS